MRLERAPNPHPQSSLAEQVLLNGDCIADLGTNIAEDVIYVHTGRIVRHLHRV